MTTDISPENVVRMLEQLRFHDMRVNLGEAADMMEALIAERTAFKGNADDAYAKWVAENERANTFTTQLADMKVDRDKWANDLYDIALQLKVAEVENAKLRDALASQNQALVAALVNATRCLRAFVADYLDGCAVARDPRSITHRAFELVVDDLQAIIDARHLIRPDQMRDYDDSLGAFLDACIAEFELREEEAVGC